MNERAEHIALMLTKTRADTLRLFDLSEERDLRESPGFGFRPVIWHLAHIGVFEGYWILQKVLKESSLDERYERIFDPINTPRENSVNLPSRREMENYLARVRERVLRGLDRSDFNDEDPLVRDEFVFQMVLEHEYQHQETLGYLLHLLDPKKKRAQPRASLLNSSPTVPRDMVSVRTGSFEMGALASSFVYDNELPRHTVEIPAFKIDRLLTTNEEFARFVDEGGYERREWWSDEGWLWREKEGWTCPLYWKRGGRTWDARRMFDEGEIDPLHPVMGVSYHEAEAYARFA